MQVTKEKLSAQQLVLFHLGFYKGNIDGIWSESSIDAKRKFEADITFLPAYPNGGLPFGERDKLPKGWRYGVKGVIGHADLTVEKAAEIRADHEARAKAALQRAAIKADEGSAQPQQASSDTQANAAQAGIKGADAVDEGQKNGLAGPTAAEQQVDQAQQAERQRREQQRADQQKHHSKGNR